MLNQLIADAEERQVQLDDAYVEQIGAILEVFLDALNLNSEPAWKVLRELLRQAGSGSPLAVSPALAELPVKMCAGACAWRSRPRCGGSSAN